MNIEKLDDKKKVSKLIGRMEALKSARSEWESDWKEIGKYMHPRREFLDDVENKTVRTGTMRYDDFPVIANQLHANGLQGNLISPAAQWFKLKFREEQFSHIPFAKDWLEACEEVLYGTFRSSNYYAATNEFVLDGGALCTAYMYTEYNPETDAVIFKTMNPGQMFIAENYYGVVDTVFREFKMTVGQMSEKFKNLPDEVKKQLEDYQLDEEHIIIHAVFKRQKRDKDKRDNQNFEYASIYIDKDTEEILLESGYMEFPYLVWRYRKNGGEVYGRGPGMDSLQLQIRLNQFAKGQLKNAQLHTDPPINAHQNMKGRVSYNPGAKNYFTNMDQAPSKMDLAGNYPIGDEVINGMKEELKQIFFIDYFMMLQNAQREMTAREVIERQGEKAAIIGSAVGRLYQEFLNPLIKRVFGMLFRAGKIPEPPAELMQYGARIDVELIGPLAMSQKHYARSQGITKGIESLMPLANIDPSVLDIVDLDVIAKESLESAGMPQKAIREDHEIKQTREARAQQQAQQQQMEQMGQMAEMTPKLNQKVEQGSPLQAIEEQLANGVSQQ